MVGSSGVPAQSAARLMLRSFVFWSSLPVVAVQALRVRRNALRMTPAEGPDSGSVGSGPPLRLLAIGDSIIAGVGASTLATALVGRTAEAMAALSGRTVHWRAIGRSGINSTDMLDELVPRLPAESVDVFVVSIGVNDVTALTRTARWKKNLDALLLALASHSPGAVVAMAGIPPLREFPLLPHPLRSVIGYRGESLDRILRDTIAAHSCSVHVPVEFEAQENRFSQDGFHPSEASYTEFGRAMAEHIVSRLPANSLTPR
ncbi:SGNH/GDSL hydrolase family protein [Dokdonella sp.]|uniref:SGNH/GDSL hydrolase family protein n=1 Tax=Dokdonella sp. TaxID=2291710 RepID=UPI0035274474